MLARERDSGRLVIIAACAVGLTIPLMFFGLAETDVLVRALVSIAVFVSAVGLIAGGLLLGLSDLHCRRLRGVRCVDLDPALANHRHVAEPVAVLPRCRCRAAGPGGGCPQTGKLVETRHRHIVRESGLMPDAGQPHRSRAVAAALYPGRAGALRTDPGHRRCRARRSSEAARKCGSRSRRSIRAICFAATMSCSTIGSARSTCRRMSRPPSSGSSRSSSPCAPTKAARRGPLPSRPSNPRSPATISSSRAS